MIIRRKYPAINATESNQSQRRVDSTSSESEDDDADSAVEVLSMPGVSVLRPLKGIDVALAENLRSSFLQEYDGPMEIIFSVADKEDPAVEVVEDLLQEFPNADAKLVIGDLPTTPNPKVNNLQIPYSQARHNIIWILDSNVHVLPQTLQSSVHLLFENPQNGLVHHLPITQTPTTPGSLLEHTFLNIAHAKMYSVINHFSIAPCIIGKSNLFRKSDVDRVEGGFAGLGRTMSEDNALGLAILSLGLKHAIGKEYVRQSLGDMSLEAFFGRRARWIRVRAHTVLAPTLLEPFSEALLSGLTFAWALSGLAGVEMWKTLVAHFVYWAWCDWNMARTFDPEFVEGNGRAFVFAWLARELTTFALWVVAVSGNTVDWRGTKYVLSRNRPPRPVGVSTPAVPSQQPRSPPSSATTSKKSSAKSRRSSARHASAPPEVPSRLPKNPPTPTIRKHSRSICRRKSQILN
ncbi:hypothetical protein HK097_009709 [Rhizophlyctis rosea]|uniref:Ceramide glucosyltransferase n=1 Tax=Rhizophlyctis rosea TaxID=64517 RepID=A0AAD5X3L7_9FUNG|nr:hypothetical protein HK097_009709 [Rhizophlyctis rosea]